MDIIKDDLLILKQRLESSFGDPFPNAILKRFICSGSKYIRSSLAVLYLKSQNIEITEDLLKILVVGEIIHNASLLHDDVLDEAQTRRGETTIAKKFSSKISVLAGDYLLLNAIEKLLELRDFDIIELFKKCTKQMTEAEIKQYFLRDKIPTEQEYIEICNGKTASLFSAILEACSKISNTDIKQAKAFGKIYGICFQIKNDLDKESSEVDKTNGIYTAKEVLGIEKTQNLLDNYNKEMSKEIEKFPQNIYRESLKDLIDLL